MTTKTDAVGRPLYASDGERLGDVDAVLDDIETRRPEWLALSSGAMGRRRLLVPVAGSEARGDGIFVRYSAEQIRSTPAVEGDEISQEAERRLYSHYGLPYSERRSATGLPERPQGRDTGRSGRRGGNEDEPTREELYREAKRLDIDGRSKMNKRELARAVERAQGSAGRGDGSRGGRAKANPIEVQKFLEGVGYPAGKQALVQEAKRQGASDEVRSTLERLPDEQFETPTDVSEAIGKLS